MCRRTETLSCFVPPRDGGGQRFANPGAPNAVRRYAYAQGTRALERATPHALMSQVPVDQDPDGYREGVAYGLWCASFFALAGLHRIYLGKYGTGIIWLLTFGLGGIGQFIDLFTMKKLVRDANIREGYLPHPRWAGELSRLAQPAGALPAAPEKPLKHLLLDAAIERAGELSVTEGVAATGASFEAVEKTLNELLETGYVDIDNRPGSGVIIYRFTELR